MQPTIIVTAPMAGMIYLNGRFAGEASLDRPLFLPVAPSGVLYLEYRPLSGEVADLARRIVLSNGAPLGESLAGATGISCLAWPGGALELEISPRKAALESFALEGLPCVLRRSEETTLSLNGLEVRLPEGALSPALLRLPGAVGLLGDVEGGGRYLAALDAALTRQAGLLTADRIDVLDNGTVNASVSLGDSVGHGFLEQWLLDGNGLNRLSSEPTWPAGAPRWPDTAEGALIAALEAAFAGLPREAEGYLSPALAAARPLDALPERYDGCVPMKYAFDSRPCAGLLKTVNSHLATVQPLYCRAEQAAGSQGPWRITSIETE